MAQGFAIFDGLLDDPPQIPAGSVVTKLVANNKRIKATLLGFAPGQELSQSHPELPAILEIWRGEGLVIVGEDAYEVGPGSWMYLDEDAPHRIQARGELVLLLTQLKPAA